jgi:autotransporter adhesin
LPPSVVTGILDPVLTGIYGPIEGNINSTLGLLGGSVLGSLGFPGPLNVNVGGLLQTAAEGDNIGLNVLAQDGTLVGPADQCNAQADSYTLDNPAGISMGGNAITGLGANGEEAAAGEINSVAIGNNASTASSALGSIALGTDSQVGATGVGSVALGSGSSVSVANSVALGAGSVADRGPRAGSVGEVSVGAPGAERQITNVAAGTAGTDAANLAQVQAVAALIPTNTVQYTDGTFARVTLAGSSGTTVGNVAAGALNGTSTEAVNGSQLFATNQQVATNTSAITTLEGSVGTLQTAVAGNTTAITFLQTDVTSNSTAITNLQANVGTNTSAITSLQTNVGTLQTDVTNLQTNVTTNTSAITNLQTNVGTLQTDVTNLQTTVNNIAVGNTGPVRYSDDATPTTPNGGTPTNDVTLVGAAPGTVGVHNVAEGVVAEGSTDAVNGGQLHLTNLAVAAAQETADQALELNQNAVTYDSAARTSVTLGNAGAPVSLQNVAAGTLGTDAVNVDQLEALADNAVENANRYTDERIASLNFDLGDVRKDARAGTSAALAAAGMPQASDPGKSMLAAGVSTYRGKSAIAIGASHRTRNGSTVFKLGLTYDSSDHVGANGGVGFQF